MKFLFIAPVLLALVPSPASAQTLKLRDTVMVSAATITLADLVEGAPVGPPLFMAPAPGATGTIKATRVKEAALQACITDIDWRALPHVAVM